MISRRTSGFSILDFVQKDDNLNFISKSNNDLLVIEDIFVKFGNLSGAILSKSWKSKLMGLGAWKENSEWPLQWLQTKYEYKNTLERSWAECSASFHKIISCSSRQLESLEQRVKVLRLFATSKLWYKASALPLPDKYARKFKAAMTHFLWIGRL